MNKNAFILFAWAALAFVTGVDLIDAGRLVGAAWIGAAFCSAAAAFIAEPRQAADAAGGAA